MPDQNIELQLQLFKEEGYAILPGVISVEVLDVARDLYKRLREEFPDTYNFGNLFDLNGAFALAVAANKDTLDFAESVMGPFVQLDGLTLAGLRPPTDGKTFGEVINWHRDPWGNVPYCEHYRPPLAINAICYLQDITDETGPFRYIPGSHRVPLTMQHPVRKLKYAGEGLLYPKAGDMLIVHNNLVHTGTPPAVRGMERNFISIFYNLTWMKRTMGNNSQKEQEYIQYFKKLNDPRMLRLFGIDMNLTNRTDTGFLSEEDISWKEWTAEDRNKKESLYLK